MNTLIGFLIAVISIILGVAIGLLFCLLRSFKENNKLRKDFSDCQFQRKELEKKNVALNNKLETFSQPEKCAAYPEIYNIISAWCKETNTKQVGVSFEYIDNNKKRLVIYTDRPGVMIGKAGSLVDKYKNILLKSDRDIYDLVIAELKAGFVNQYPINIDKYYSDFMQGFFAYEEAGENDL